VKAQQVICELSNEKADSPARLVLHTEDQSPPVSVVRRGTDIFFLSGKSEVIAAFVRMDSGPTAA